MSKNSNLNKAKKEKNDEFYTQLSDIEKEMVHYKQHFNGKTVYCNCDDYRRSNFWKYFYDNFNELQLKKLTATNYNIGEGAYRAYYDGENMTVVPLQGNGDFRSPECIEFLKEADIVVTNPPFSLFKEYIKQLMDFNKKFIIIGNGNAVTYKEVFPLIKENKLWFGASKGIGGKLTFKVPETYEGKFVSVVNGTKTAQVNNVCWFTNIPRAKRNNPLTLYKHYSNEYKHYDNYDAIEVSETADIPMDYDGVMGVPITFLDKYCPEQFEIVGWSRHNDMNMDGGYWLGGKADATINGEEIYRRILIRHRK